MTYIIHAFINLYSMKDFPIFTNQFQYEERQNINDEFFVIQRTLLFILTVLVWYM